MQTYRATQTLTVGAGLILHLTEEQAKTRAHNLTVVGEGRYQTTAPVQFKRGEVVHIDGALPKGHEAYAAVLEDSQGQEAPATGEPAPAAAAAKDAGKKKSFFRK